MSMKGKPDDARFLAPTVTRDEFLRRLHSADQRQSLVDRCATGGHRVSRDDGQCLCGVFCTLDRFIQDT